VLALFVTLFAQTHGRLEPVVRVSGAEASCKVTAMSGATARVEGEKGVDLAAGVYDVLVACPAEDAPLVAFQRSVRIESGKTAAPKVELTPATVRVEARRNEVLLPAKARFFASAELLEPLFEIPANQSKAIASGAYHVLVALQDPSSPPAEALVVTKVAGKKTTVVEADLSDGGLVVHVASNGRPAPATVRASPPGKKKDVGIVESGEELRLPAGRYAIVSELRESSDFATKEQLAWVRAGKITTLRESFEVGRLTVVVTQDGRPIDATVRISKPGATDFFNHFPAPGTVSLTPGTFDLNVASPALGPIEKILDPNVVVRPRAETKRTLDLTPASVSVEVTKNGAKLEVPVSIRDVGGGAVVEPQADGRWRLWPGRYEAVAVVDESVQIDGPFEVKLRDRIVRRIAIELARLTVRTMRGKAVAADAEVLVFRPGASKPVAKARGGAQLEIPPGVYDVKVVAGAETVWKNGVKVRRVTSVDVELAPSKDTPDEALPDGDLPPPGDDLPEGDAEPEGPTG
jgi:hypothetical protein